MHTVYSTVLVTLKRSIVVEVVSACRNVLTYHSTGSVSIVRSGMVEVMVACSWSYSTAARVWYCHGRETDHPTTAGDFIVNVDDARCRWDERGINAAC